MPPYSARTIANEFLDIAAKKHHALNLMSLQKLVILAHGWHLALKSEPLICEPIAAFRYGPGVQSLLQEFHCWGQGPILCPALEVVFGPRVKKPRVEKDDSYTLSLLLRVWEVYGHYTAVQLANLLNGQDTPWRMARNSNQSFVPDGELRRYYASQKQGGSSG